MTKKHLANNKPTAKSCNTERNKVLSISIKNLNKEAATGPPSAPKGDRSSFASKQKKREKDFKAQLVVQDNLHPLSTLEHRLSSNLSILVPLLKRSCPNNLLQIENLNSAGKPHINEFEKFTPQLGCSLSPPQQLGCSLPPPQHPQFTQLRIRQRRKKKRSENSLILPIASASHLIPRPNSRQVNDLPPLFSARGLRALPSGGKLSPEQRESTDNGFVEGDSVGHNDNEVKHPLLQIHSSETTELSPIVSCGGKICLGLPGKLSKPTVVNLSVRPKVSSCIRLNRQLTLQNGWGASPRTGLLTAPVQKLSQEGLYIIEGSGGLTSNWDSSEQMGSNSNIRQRKSTEGSSKTTITEHHSYVNLSSNLNVPVTSLGHMSMQGPKKSIKNSKSFHGDASNVSESTRPPLGGSITTSAPMRQQQFHRKVLERQRIKMLKPLSVTKTQGNITKLCEIGTAEFGSGLPETGTASYRLTHDVSFDEGSRYNGGYAFAEEQRVPALTGGTSATRNKANLTYLNHEHQNPSQTRLEKVDPPTRERHTPVTYKETMPLSLVRIEERLSFDSPLGRHPTSTGFSIPTTTRGQSAQGGNHPSPSTPINNGGTVTTFRLHKERQNWNYRAGDLSVNGGGYYGSTPIQPGGRAESSGLGPLNISPASNFAHRMAASRDKQSSAAKTRLSSRYGSRNDGSPQSYGNSSNKDSQYADPCIAAPPSFQQRLTELSILESDTIKYERNRKLKRKKNQDKDS
ncbi:uncharacterized protein LOC104265834 [Ciona intestinalis]